MARYAYLIIAHNEPVILKTLVMMLDNPQNDIYIHIDLKVDFKKLTEEIKTNFSRLFYSKRYDVRWGDSSQILVEFELFEMAYKSCNNYSYYHLLSGVDLPIKKQSYIQHFFEKNKGKEFVSYWECSRKELYDKVLCYNFFTKRLQSNKVVIDFIFRRLRKLVCILQRGLHLKRNFPYELAKGSNWVSITNDFCEYLLSQKEKILKCTKFTCCADEIFVQSCLKSSSFYKNVWFDDDMAMRQINWQGNSPQNWENEDFDNLRNSDKLFARKFSSENMVLINKIFEMCRE